ncbi:MAG: sensor histidine kinase [Candidatus Marinimicrobia bacterium]|nr:sensor histidine kinase [Candidatus Neomarinimicrobiota bacterium]
MDRTNKLQEEVLERKDAQETAQNALKQKDVLLREVYHRTKNNMNVVISLLNMQSAEQNKRPVEDAFSAISDRIYSMSLVHEQLYRSEDLSTIRFDEYVKTLVSRLHYSMPKVPGNIRVSYECEAIEIGLAEAVPLGLAVNEIVTNAFKHGFPDGRKGQIQIHMKNNKMGNLLIEVINDGLVFLKDVNIDNPETLGLHLIKMLIQDQLQSKLSIVSNKNVRYTIELLPTED